SDLVEYRPLHPSSFADAEIVLFAISDGAIPQIYRQVQSSIPAETPVFHASGALSSELFDHIHRFSLHPLRSLAPAGSPSSGLDGTLLVWEGESSTIEIAQTISHIADGELRAIETTLKPLYHAAAVFGSNYVAASLGAASELMEAVGIDGSESALRELARSAIDNWISQEGQSKFTGPIARGETDIIRRHLEALEPFPLHDESYRVLARLLLEAIAPGSRDSNLQEINRLVHRKRPS
ncbi:MAG: DUF2520 domain-containing protein, partial [Acidobacteria bacterium]|nr:DUF2520 domain-containing protein [Acidobacteriota bacterium]